VIQANDLDHSELADEEFQQFIEEANLIESKAQPQEEEKKVSKSPPKVA
jgi:hypothetical protein